VRKCFQLRKKGINEPPVESAKAYATAAACPPTTCGGSHSILIFGIENGAKSTDVMRGKDIPIDFDSVDQMKGNPKGKKTTVPYVGLLRGVLVDCIFQNICGVAFQLFHDVVVVKEAETHKERLQEAKKFPCTRRFGDLICVVVVVVVGSGRLSERTQRVVHSNMLENVVAGRIESDVYSVVVSNRSHAVNNNQSEGPSSVPFVQFLYSFCFGRK
jgi:hypothetical protein